MYMKILIRIKKEIFDFSNYSAELKYYDDSNKFVVAKMKDETVGVAIKEFAGSKPKIYSILVDDSSEHKKGKGVNKHVVATISHGQYKKLLLNTKYLKQAMNTIQSKHHRIRAHKINKTSLSCFDDKTYIRKNGYD